MSPIQNLREIEDNGLRGDIYEGISSVKNYPPGQFRISSIGYQGNYLALHIRESYEKVFGNIYSLYCISLYNRENLDRFKIDKRMKEFGSHCLIIKDNKKFLSLIETKLRELRINFWHDFVRYYDKEAVSKGINLFEKPLEFEYQKEFRFYVERKATDCFSFSIGSLTDISEIYPSHLIVDELKLQLS